MMLFLTLLQMFSGKSPLIRSVLTAANVLRLILFLIISRMALAPVAPKLQ